jgi:hypothetical protein
MNVFATGVPVNERFAFAAAILNGREAGAGSHCLEQLRNTAGEVVSLTHWRLGIHILFA